MKRRIKRLGWAAYLLAAFSMTLLAGPPASRLEAYVLEGPHVLDLTVQAMGKIAALKANQKLLIYPQHPEETPAVFDETVIYVMPQRFRSEIVSDRIQRTHLEVGEASLTVIDGRLAASPDPFDRYQRLLRSRTRGHLMRTLNTLGIETAITSLGRVDETVVFVIGARYPDESVSQLAIDKETFLPVRLLLIDAEPAMTGRHLEIYYHKWRKLQDGWFPMQVTFYTDGRLDREIRLVDLRLNPSIPAETLDLEALKASLAVQAVDAPHERKDEAVEEVQRAVQDFQKKFD